MIDVVEVRKQVVQDLKGHDFRPRDADGTDFQFGNDPGLRFKVGTSRGEVTVTVWRYSRQIKAIRITTPAKLAKALTDIGVYVLEFKDTRRVNHEEVGS